MRDLFLRDNKWEKKTWKFCKSLNIKNFTGKKEKWNTCISKIFVNDANINKYLTATVIKRLEEVF